MVDPGSLNVEYSAFRKLDDVDLQESRGTLFLVDGLRPLRSMLPLHGGDSYAEHHSVFHFICGRGAAWLPVGEGINHTALC